jgi:biuret amidohydrolase
MIEVNGLEVPRSLDDLLDPRRAALIVYDMQVGITRQIGDRERVLQQVRHVLDGARQSGVRTFFTRHMSLPKEVMGSMQYRTAMAWQHTDDPTRVKSPFLRDSAGFAIEPTS